MQNLLWTATLPDNTLDFQSIDLFLINLSETNLNERYHSILQASELEAANAFIQEHRHQVSIASRSALRLLLSYYLHEHPALIVLQKNEFKKPVLSEQYNFYFNVSHSNDQILIGFYRMGLLGVDMETTQTNVDWRMIAKRYFSPAEKTKIDKAKDPQYAFFQLWTAKEAFMKGVGSGFQFPLHHYFIDYQDDEFGKVISTIPLYPPDWKIRNIDLPQQCVGAVSSPISVRNVRCFIFTDYLINQIAASWDIQ
jgi:4'-phosphopantetheinyl transferase